VLTLSLALFRSRWPLFVGALLSVATGVALIDAATSIAASSGPPDTSRLTRYDALQIREAYDGVASVAVITAMLAAVLTVFIVATTFGFTVAQRRRDLAQLRLLGTSPRQVRLMLVGEAIVLGVLGAVVGVPLGRAAAAVQLWLLRRNDFVPDDFELTHPAWASVLAAGTGVLVAVLGVLAASRYAARVPPLEALRDAPQVSQVMTRSRWAWGLLLLATTLAMVAVAPLAGLVAALALSLGIALTGAVALSRLSPVFVPLVGRGLALCLRSSTLGTLAQANLRDGVQRTAATAGPLIVLVALLLSVAGALGATTEATALEERANVAGDAVVETTGAQMDRVGRLPEVVAVSPQVSLPAVASVPVRNGGDTEVADYTDGVIAVEPAAYERLHHRTPRAGKYADLKGNAIGVTEHTGDGERVALGTRATLDLGGHVVAVRVALVLPERLSTDEDVLVPRELVPAALLDRSAATVVARLASTATVDALDATVSGLHLGTARTVAAWVDERATEAQKTNDATLVVLLSLSGLYAGMSVVNAVVIAGASRAREHAIARLTGLTRPQVLIATVVEALSVAVIGLALGGVVVISALAAIAISAKRNVGEYVLDVPWALTTATALGAVLVAAITAAATAVVALRPPPISVAAARE
jgi:putative ABC transport system permease protein